MLSLFRERGGNFFKLSPSGQNCRRLVAVERLLDQKLNIIEVVMPCFCFSSKRNRDSLDAQTIAAVEGLETNLGREVLDLSTREGSEMEPWVP